ncbi:MAG: hypothetical protein K0S18_2189 [Anaerocolumna sp.]|nr:hypothetical protein [Anaerocolumna sp.]
MGHKDKKYNLKIFIEAGEHNELNKKITYNCKRQGFCK